MRIDIKRLIATTLAVLGLLVPTIAGAAGPGGASTAAEAIRRNPRVLSVEAALEARGFVVVSESVSQFCYFAVPEPPYVWGYFDSSWVNRQGNEYRGGILLRIEVSLFPVGYRVTSIDTDGMPIE